jgi:hypothetical protein
MSNNQRIKAILTGVLVVLSLVVASCGPLEARVDTGEGEAVVGVRHGMELSLDAVPPTGVPVLCHGQAPAGVASIELYVNGMFVGRAGNTAGPGTHEFNYFTAEMSFEPDGPGAYELRCRTQDHEGRSINSADVTIFLIGEAVPSPPPEVPTATPTETEVPPEVPTATPTSTGVPTHTPTSTALPTDTPTATPSSTPTTQPRVVITRFEVDKTQITKGECVRFDWEVQAPTEIYFDGQGVTTNPGSEDRCPTSTRAYELVANGYGGPVTASITVVVLPGDTEGPSIYRETGPKVMAAPMGGYCRDPYEFGAMVVDPSGVRWVKLICSFNQGPDQSCGGLQHLGSNSYQIEYRLPTDGSVQSGDSMHWHIRACDMVDPMNCTNSPTHDIPIGPCVI